MQPCILWSRRVNLLFDIVYKRVSLELKKQLLEMRNDVSLHRVGLMFYGTNSKLCQLFNSDREIDVFSQVAIS